MKQSNQPNEGHFSPYGFQVQFKEDEKYYFRFNDKNGEPLLFSKSYSSEKSCAGSIQALIRVAGEDDHYELKETKKEKYFFILKAGNHQEIARSRIFDSVEELEKQMELLKGIDENVPQYGVANAPSAEEKAEEPEKEKPPKDKEKTGRSEEKQSKKAAPQKEPATPPEIAEKRPRYKFSAIYYPDSKVWMIKNDFSGGSLKLKTCDGQQIADFMINQLPPEERQKLEPAAKPQRLPEKESRERAQKPVQKDLELYIRTHQGELVQKFAQKEQISKVELVPKISGDAQPLTFEAKILARSMEDNQTVTIGSSSRTNLMDGRFEVPLFGIGHLKPGLYVLSANVYQSKQGAKELEYYGRQMLMLN